MVTTIFLVTLLVGLASGAVLAVLQLTDVLVIIYSVLFSIFPGLRNLFIKNGPEGIYTREQLLDMIQNTMPFWAELLDCIFCLGTWTTFFFVFLALFLFKIPVWFILIMWPAGSAIAFKIRKYLGE